jgi:hypothetical protein
MNGFLQLLWAPRNVQVTPVERTALKVGEQLPLTTAGRSFGSEAELQISPSKLARIHGRLAFRDKQWRVSHAAADLRTLVNGTPEADAVLQHLDVLELPDSGPVFRFLTAPIAEGPAAQLSLDDVPRLAVWADTLLEANDPLGERVARALKGEARPEDDLRWLGPLARTFVEGRLEVEWSHGLLRRAVLRDLQPFGAEPLSSMDLLLRLPVARFLEQLVLDAGGVLSNAQAFVEVLKSEQTAPLPALKSLHLGDCAFSDPWVDEAEVRLRNALRAKYPGLGAAPLFGRFRRAALIVEKAGLRQGEQPGDEQELGESLELIDVAAPSRGVHGPVGIAFWRLQRKHAHWELDAVPASPSGITLNGRPVLRAALRDGDQIALSTGVVYRFRLER